MLGTVTLNLGVAMENLTVFFTGKGGVGATTPRKFHPLILRGAALAVVALAIAPSVEAQEAQSLASQVTNPISSLVSVPIQGNYDSNIGPNDDGTRLSFNIQPVIPTSLNADWNLIARVIVPVVSQDDIFPGAGDQFGLGDTTVSLFFRRWSRPSAA